jgi:hypothetical protein
MHAGLVWTHKKREVNARQEDQMRRERYKKGVSEKKGNENK